MTPRARASRRRILLGLALGVGALLDGREGEHARPRPEDLRRAVSRSPTAGLPGLLRFALEETRAAVAAGVPVSGGDGERLGALFGDRLWSLATAGGDLGGASHFAPLRELEGLVAAARVRARPADPAARAAVDGFHAGLARALDRSGRGMAGLPVPAGRRPGERRVLITAFDPFTDAGWNPSAAAALALAGTCVPVDRASFVRISSVVFPVDYRRFAQGVVESALQPALAGLDAVVTVSMDPALRGRMALERYAVDFHWVDPPVCAADDGPAVVSGPIPPPPGPGGPPPGRGPAVLSAWGGVDALAAPRRSDRWETFVRSDLRLRFASRAAAADAMRDLGAPTVEVSADASVVLRDPLAIGRLLAASAAPAPGAENRLVWRGPGGAGRVFDAEVTSGPGGNFLSNEVSYRVLRLVRSQPGPASRVASFHVHTPDAPPAADPAAWEVRGRVVAEVRRLVVECLRRVGRG